MRTAAVLLSHALTDAQVEDLRRNWSAEIVKTLPEELQRRWSNVPPDGPFPVGWLAPLIAWLEAETAEDDVVVVQGEPGCVYYVVNWCFRHRRLPLYAATAREAQEERRPDGTVITQRVFRHRGFRAYPEPSGAGFPSGAGGAVPSAGTAEPADDG